MPHTREKRTQQLRFYLEGFWATWIFHVGWEMGLFQALEGKPITPAQLAEARGFELTYIEVWCRAAAAYDFLEGDRLEGYQVAPGWNTVMDYHGAWAGTYIRLSERIYESLEAVFKGRAFPESGLTLRMLLAPGMRASYRWLWTELAPTIEALQERLQPGRRLIEFGCGFGLGLEVVKEIHPRVELTGLESDYDCAREAERATRAVIVVGSPEESSYQNRFDVAVFHRSLTQCREPQQAIRKAVQALRPGGVLMICSEAELPSQESELARIRLGERFFYQMFLAPEPLQSLPLDMVEGWCRQDGLTTLFRLSETERGSPTLVLQKPGAPLGKG